MRTNIGVERVVRKTLQILADHVEKSTEPGMLINACPRMERWCSFAVAVWLFISRRFALWRCYRVPMDVIFALGVKIYANTKECVMKLEWSAQMIVMWLPTGGE